MTTKGYKDVKMRNVSKQRMALYIEWAAKKDPWTNKHWKYPTTSPRKKLLGRKNKAYFKINLKIIIFPLDDFLFGSAVVLLSTSPNDTEK